MPFTGLTAQRNHLKNTNKRLRVVMWQRTQQQVIHVVLIDIIPNSSTCTVIRIITKIILSVFVYHSCFKTRSKFESHTRTHARTHARTRWWWGRSIPHAGLDSLCPSAGPRSTACICGLTLRRRCPSRCRPMDDHPRCHCASRQALAPRWLARI